MMLVSHFFSRTDFLPFFQGFVTFLSFSRSSMFTFVSVHCPTYILVDLDLPTTCAYIPYITIYHSCIYS